MSVGAIVFARMSSNRLPGKSLLPIGSEPLLAWVLQRVARATVLSEVVVATSIHPTDDPVVEFARSAGVPVFRGSLQNVAERALHCAREFGMSGFARVCGDRVFLEPMHLDDAVSRFSESGDPVDLVTNTLGGPVAAGLTTEVVRTDALADVLAQATDPQDLEHVTRYFYAHAGRYRLVTGGVVQSTFNDVRFVVDTPEDLARARYVVARLEDPATAGLSEVAALARAFEQQRLGYTHA